MLPVMVDNGQERPYVIGRGTPRHAQGKIREVAATLKADRKRRAGGASDREIAQHNGITARRGDDGPATLTAKLLECKSVDLRGISDAHIAVYCGHGDARIVSLALVMRLRNGKRQPVSR